MSEQKTLEMHMLRTYASLRWLIALVTLAFLATLWTYRDSGHDTQPRNSISAYYHHDNRGFRMKDVFVAAFCAVGVLLVAYKGFTWRETWALTLAGVALLLVVYFPMDWPPIDDAVPVEKRPPTSEQALIHYSCALLFFFTLGYVCLFRAHDTLGYLRFQILASAYRRLYRLV